MRWPIGRDSWEILKWRDGRLEETPPGKDKTGRDGRLEETLPGIYKTGIDIRLEETRLEEETAIRDKTGIDGRKKKPDLKRQQAGRDDMFPNNSHNPSNQNYQLSTQWMFQNQPQNPSWYHSHHALHINLPALQQHPHYNTQELLKTVTNSLHGTGTKKAPLLVLLEEGNKDKGIDWA